MSDIPKKEDRPTINRSYDIFVDQNEWLVNSPLNKSKLIRQLLDNHINERDATVIQNLQDEIDLLNNLSEKEKEIHENEIENYIQIKIKRIKEHDDQIRELLEKIESQKAMIVALGGEE